LVSAGVQTLIGSKNIDRLLSICDPAAGFGFDSFDTILFNIPFAFFQVVITLIAAWISTKLKLKWPVIVGLSIPPIAGAAALLRLGRGKDDRGALLACYYVVSININLSHRDV
jgi:hypothetical protein